MQTKQPTLEPLADAFRACRAHFMPTALFSALINVLYLAPTIYMMQIYDRVVPTGGIFTLFWMTVIVGVAIAALSALDTVRNRLMMRASMCLNRQLSGAILERLLLQVKGNSDPAAGQTLREFDTFRQAITSPGIIALFDLPWTPIYLLVAFLIHPLLAGLIALGGVILFLLAVLNQRATQRSSEEMQKANAANYARQEMIFEKAETVRALGMRRALVSQQMADRQAGLAAGATNQVLASRYGGWVKFARMFMQSLALGAGAWLAINGQVSVGAIIAASVLLARALQPIEQIVSGWSMLGQALHSKKTIEKLFLSTETLVQRRLALPAPEGYVELSNVVVRTPDNCGLILRGVSTWLVPGEVVCLLGPSGAGKTTLARVAAGAISPDGGEIRIDEAQFSDWDHEQLAMYIGYLPQEAALLPGTIGENISRFAAARGDNQADVDHKVTMAAKSAGIHDLILHLPGGYNARIGGTELRLSGGQAQRIALARALYDQPRVLILDEPNASLDSQGEEALSDAILAAKKRGAAILIVTHRQSALRYADRLVVLSEGTVEHQGPRDEVLRIIHENAEKAAANVVKMTRE